MRVLLIRSTEVSPDPPVEKMAVTLSEQGHEVTILAWDRTQRYREKTNIYAERIRIVHFGIPAQYGGGMKKNFFALLTFQCRILLWMLRHHKQYDVIHAFDFDTGYAAMIASKLLNKKLIYHILDYYVDGHELSGSTLIRMIENSEIRVINQADITIVCTEKRREQINKANPRKLYVIHNTPQNNPPKEQHAILQSDKDRIRVVYVGILSDSRLLKETVEVIADMPDVEFHIGGFGPQEEWMKDQSKKHDNIFYYGRLPYHDTLTLEQQCHMMVAVYDPGYRNHKYAAPNKFYESIMLGKPIIMARDTGYDDIIVSNEIGMLVEFTRDGIRQGIQDLIAKRNDWPEMGRRAKMLYDTAFSWEIMKVRIADIYRDL